MTYPVCCICGGDITETLLTETVTEGEARCWHPECLPVLAKLEEETEVEPARLPEWQQCLLRPLVNRLAILEDLQDKGVEFRVCAEKLQYRDTQKCLTEEEIGFIADFPEVLKEAWLKQQRLCLRCQMEAAKHGADWCGECLRSEGWKHYQRLASTQRRKKRQTEAEPTAVQTEERTKSLWE